MFSQTLRRTVYIGLFAIPFVPFLVSSIFFFPFIVTKAFAWRIIVEIIFAAWLLLALLDTKYRPKRTLISYAILIFLVTIGLADLLGLAPIKSFWSNFERMEGYITLIHLGMFFAVISSVFGNDPAGSGASWKRWWNVSLVASFLMSLYCVLQLIGLKTINQGGVRVDGTLGNAIYLAVYMLFHIFIAVFFMWKEWKNVSLRWVYGILILSQLTVLYYTATRGAILGLLVGVLVATLLNLRNKESKVARRTSITVLVGLIILIGSFLAIKDTEFVRKSQVLSRFSSLTTGEIKTQGRYFVWPMAIRGIKDRPILGWGQENFNLIFQEHYSPEMFRLEPWFDRAHNIFLDWAVSGGLLGLLSYLFLYIALLYSIWKKRASTSIKGEGFSYAEKSILTGLVAAYFFHNFFVFDHLISYILFFSLLAFVEVRNSEFHFLGKRFYTEIQVKRIALPALAIVLFLSLYFVNIKPIMANIFLINALKAVQTPGGAQVAIEYFKKAYNASTLGRPEIVEHISINATAVFSSDLSTEEKNAYFAFVKDVVLGEEKSMGNDSRYQLMTGSLFSSVGLLDDGLAHLRKAQELIPGKQQVYFEIGALYINMGDYQKAMETFKEAYELAPDYVEARLIYLIGSIYAGDRVAEEQILLKLDEREVASDDRVLNAYHSNSRDARVVQLLETRIKFDPDNKNKYEDLIKQLQG